MTIVYSLVARGSTVLCSHQIGAGNFEDVSRSMLPNIPTRNNTKTTYTSNNFLFHVIVENGLIFMCAADPDFGRRQPYAYLTEVKNRFLTSSLASRAQFANEGELDRDFTQVLSSQMERYSNPEETDNVAKLRAQVDDVKGVMTQNIEKVLERGENLDNLVEQTSNLEAHSASFQKSARRVHRKMWWKNTKMTICLVATVLIVILVIVLIILFSTGVLPKKSSPDSPSSTLPPSTTPPTV